MAFVRQHRGWIEVASQVGTGSVFTIYLPAAIDASAVVQTFDPGASQLQTGDETILLVEDEPSLRAMARKLLEHLGYHVYEASDGVAALSVWKEHRAEIDLLLTDMVMPNGNDRKRSRPEAAGRGSGTARRAHERL